MLYTIQPDEMKRVERRMMEATGTSGLTLMERAAAHVADAAAPYLRDGGRLLVLCGQGNNGGDGLAAARLLMGRMPGLKTVIWRLPGAPSAETAVQWTRLDAFTARLTVRPLEKGLPAETIRPVCVLDALFGTGLNRPLEGVALEAARWLNGSGLPVVAVDIPSGLDGRTGYPVGMEVGGAAVRATATVTFHRPKPGLFLGEGPDTCGRVVVGDIGIPDEWDGTPGLALLNRGDRLLPARRRNTHKGDYGRVLALVGSPGMAGAAAICATAALRAGAGLVTVACPASVVPVVQAVCPCATCLPLPESNAQEAWQTLLPALERADALVAGCGMGQGKPAADLLDRLIPWLCEHHLPAVLDADALNLLVKGSAMGRRLPDSVALTPHIGEAARLLGTDAARVAADQVASARALRERYGGLAVLKSATTVLIGAKGEGLNAYGAAAMAKGGSGDALAGVLGALMAGAKTYGLTDIRLLMAACALHGLAGLAASEARGERGMLATDLCDALGQVPDVIERESAGVAACEAPCAATFDASTLSMRSSEEEAALVAGENTPAPAKPHPAREALGRMVRVTVDRPLGTRHPERREVVYGLNYGYVADVLAADNEWQDAYVLGVSEPVEVFEGEVVAVIHRLNGVEDKWVVAARGTRTTEQEVRARTAFVEQYFKSEVFLK
ncbi:MAG: NAD(P)H-hydrate dehydratase [Clostridiales bacterium]|nr:NAD(P)H-hydrate dehydratase [Clostridiales bacterium]